MARGQGRVGREEGGRVVPTRSRACGPLPGRGRKVPTSGAKRQERVTGLVTASTFGQRGLQRGQRPSGLEARCSSRTGTVGLAHGRLIVCVHVCALSRVQLFTTPRTATGGLWAPAKVDPLPQSLGFRFSSQTQGSCRRGQGVPAT